MHAQVTAILACAELYFSGVAWLLEARRTLQAQLRHADAGLNECGQQLAGCDSGVDQLQVRAGCTKVILRAGLFGRAGYMD